MEDNRQLLASKDEAVAKDFWEHLSAYYVEITDFDDLRTRATVDALLEEAQIEDNANVLDAGCGHLRITAGALRVKKNLNITGVDLTVGLLQQGSRLCAKSGIWCKLCCGDLLRLPFDTASFDGGISARVFQYISDPVTALKEIRRVLKPGRRFAFSVPNKYNFIKRMTYKGRLSSPHELGSWMRAAGFADVRVRSICFVPGPFSRGWDSKLRCLECAGRVPGIGLLGGNALAGGRA